MDLSNLHPAKNSRKNKRRVGRGPGSGRGKTSGRGSKGQKSRSGYSRKIGFEGGQMPLNRRVPKRGFTNIFRIEYNEVNLDRLEKIQKDTIELKDLVASRVIKKESERVKILGRGDITSAKTVHAHKFTRSAQKKIEEAGGKAVLIGERVMLDSIRNIFSIPELRRRVLFTLALLAVYRIGAQIPNPGISASALAELWESQKGTILGMVDLFTGRSMSRMTIFALGIMPYISASIILQLLQVVWPYLERLSKEGEMGRKKITQYTRYGTLFICMIQSGGIAFLLKNLRSPVSNSPIVPNGGLGFILMTMLTLTTGTVFIMWLGEQISERGIGNGISLIIFAGIVVDFPRAALSMIQGLRTGDQTPLRVIFLLALMLAVIAIIVFVERGQRRLPVSYAKRVVGRKIYGGQSTHLPLRVNTGGVIPIIFAASVITIPMTIAQMVNVPFLQNIAQQFSPGMPMYFLFYVASIIFFTYFYVSIIFNPVDVADNLRKYGGFIPGIRPGKNTADYIDSVLSRLTLVGALYLAAVAAVPEILISGLRVDTLPLIGPFLDRNLPEWFSQGMGLQFYFGGTSILIVVGVAMDTLQQIEAQLVMRHYDGFMRRSRLKGRRG